MIWVSFLPIWDKKSWEIYMRFCFFCIFAKELTAMDTVMDLYGWHAKMYDWNTNYLIMRYTDSFANWYFTKKAYSCFRIFFNYLANTILHLWNYCFCPFYCYWNWLIFWFDNYDLSIYSNTSGRINLFLSNRWNVDLFPGAEKRTGSRRLMCFSWGDG